jgi:MRG-binding protein
MDVDNDSEVPFDELDHILNTVDGEICFFRSLMRARPIGMHRHFHIMSMQLAIEKALKQPVSVEDLWRKLDTCYNMEQLDLIVRIVKFSLCFRLILFQESEYEAAVVSSPSSTPQAISSPLPEDDLNSHPYFKHEFQLPVDRDVDELIIKRRMRNTPSPISSPEPIPPEPIKPTRTRKRKASKADLAGLISGDSDSSALTQESGDDVEGVGTPTDRRAASVGTAPTDAGTEETHEEDEETGTLS